MSQNPVWRQPLSASQVGEADLPRFLTELAIACETERDADEAGYLAAAIPLLGTICAPDGQAEWERVVERVNRLLEAGAHESAVLALIPNGATWTGARLPGGEVVAQVVLEDGNAAHCRKAHSPAMGWLAALLRARSCQIGKPGN